MHGSTFDELENLFLALSDKTRLRLLALMADGEVSVGFLADKLGESQPKISRHLAYLRNAGIVSARREGKRIFYNLQKPADAAVERVLGATIKSIARVTGESESVFRAGTRPDAQGSSVETEDIYAQTDRSDYRPDEMPIYLL